MAAATLAPNLSLKRTQKKKQKNYPATRPISTGYNFNFPLPHTVSPIIAANVTIPTVVADACGAAPPPCNPRNLGQPRATSCTPTIVTTSPVTSGGKSGRNRGKTRASSASNRPEITVMKKTSRKPPTLPAKIDAEIYEGPPLMGQKYQ